MKLTRTSSYALQAVVHMATAGDDRPLASHHTARAGGVSGRFLLRVLHRLVTAGILRSVKGYNGGFWLARPADKITVLEVVEAVDGPIRGENPFAVEPWDGLTDRLQAICDDAAERTRKVLGRVRISDLAGAGKA